MNRKGVDFAFSWIFAIIAGAVILFADLIKPLHEHKKKLVILFSIFVLVFTLNRYSPDSLLNGDNWISLVLFFGSIIFFLGFVLVGSFHMYHKRREHYTELLKLNGSLLFVLVWFFITIVGARTIVRLIIMFSPTLVILASYALVRTYDYASQQQHRLLRTEHHRPSPSSRK